MRKTLFSVLLLALSVAASGQGLVPTTGTISGAGSSCSSSSNAGNCVLAQLPATISVASVTLGGTWSATIQFEVSADNQNTWVSVLCAPQPSGTSVSSATANGTWVCPVGAMTFIRARASAFTSGIPTVVITPGSASGSVLPNTGSAGALCDYAAAGGSNVCGPSADLVDSGTGTLSVGAVGVGTGVLTIVGSTSGSVNITCQGAACTTLTTGSPFQFTANGGITLKHFGQIAASNFGGTCTMAATTSCTITLNATYSNPLCFAGVNSAAPTTFQGSATLSGTTLTITASAANSNAWVAFCMGNPN